MAYKVIGVGELLWDLLPNGRQMGGAPANFAYHARALGADGHVISRVGDDSLGLELIEGLKKLGVPTHGVSLDTAHPTGTVTIEIAAGGQPIYHIHKEVAWDYLEATPELIASVSSADAVCFGTLGQRCENSRHAIRSLLAATPPESLRVFDVNLRQDYYSRAVLEESLELANVVKVNDAELPVVAELLGIEGGLRELSERYRLRFAACTCGSEGSLLYDGHRLVEEPGLSVAVRDTIGAGDAFTAAMTLGILAGWTIEEIGERANRIAAYVCSFDGATPPLPPEWQDNFKSELNS